jgi:hypothetical protein
VQQSAKSLLWLTFLALLPGCALFGGGSTSVEAKKIYDRNDSPYAEPKERKDAGAEKPQLQIEVPDPADARPMARLLQGPALLPDGELAANPKFGVMGISTFEPGTLQGNPGIATVESFLPMVLKTTAAQGPPPLPPLDKKSDLAPLTRALQLMLDGRHQEAIEVLRVYDPETQEFFLRVLPPLVVFAKTPISKLSAPEIDLVNKSFERLHYVLRTRCELLISRMHYCKEIRGFGDFDTWPDNHPFLNATKDRPGERVQFYVELKNFASVKGEDGAFLTKLACSLTLKDANDKEVKWIDANNNEVKSIPFDRKETTYRRSACLNDYHGNFSFYVPPIPAGTYKLILQVVDETIPNEHYRVARKSLDFRVTPVANQTTLR